MKIMITLAALIAFSLPAKAQQITNAQAVKIVVPYKTVCSSVTIGTTATELTGNTSISTTTAGISALSVLSFDTANTVYCSDNSGVASSGNLIGWPIAYSPTTGPRAWQSWALSTMQPWYCVASAANVSIEVCKVR